MPNIIKVESLDFWGRKKRDPFWQKRVYSKDDAKEVNKFLKTFNKLLYAKSPPKKKIFTRSARGAYSKKQLCTVKCRYGFDKDTHKAFLAEYLTQENKPEITDKPKLFSSEPVDDIFIRRYSDVMTGLHYKFIISPESQDIDMELMVKTLVKRMEAATGHSFHWFAATHTNTSHTHSHLLINGRDKNGREVNLDQTFKTFTVRELSRDICTSIIGERSREQIKESVEKSYLKCRYTPIDDALNEREHPYKEHPAYESVISTGDRLLKNRLEFLTSLDLAVKLPDHNSTYYMEKGWKNKLKAIGRFNSFVDSRNSLLHTSKINLELFTNETGPVEGVITKLYRMNDEDSWNHAVLVENKKQGRAWYVRLYFEPDQELLNSHVKCGFAFNKNNKLVPKITVKKWATPPAQREKN